MGGAWLPPLRCGRAHCVATSCVSHARGGWVGGEVRLWRGQQWRVGKEVRTYSVGVAVKWIRPILQAAWLSRSTGCCPPPLSCCPTHLFPPAFQGECLTAFSAYKEMLGIKAVAWSPSGQLLALGDYEQVKYDRRVCLVCGASFNPSCASTRPPTWQGATVLNHQAGGMLP